MGQSLAERRFFTRDGDTGKRTNATFRGIRPKPYCENNGNKKWDCVKRDSKKKLGLRHMGLRKLSVTAFYVFFKNVKNESRVKNAFPLNFDPHGKGWKPGKYINESTEC